MHKKRRATLDQMLTEWSDAERSGAFDEIGWSGGLMAQWIEFKGMPPKGTGQDQSNTGLTIAVEKLEKRGLMRALQVKAALVPVMKHAKLPAQALMLQYLRGGTKKTRARDLGLDYETYCVMVDCAMQLLAREVKV